MTAPKLTVAIQGAGEVDADQLNTYVQSCDTAAQLAAFIGGPGVEVLLRGLVAINDGGGGTFYWNASGTANDGFSNIQPSGVTLGCWTRLTANGGGVTIVLAGATLTLTALDGFVSVNKTTGSATAILLPTSPFLGETHTITDGKGDAASNNITINGNGNNISGAATKVISSNYGSRTVRWAGTQWLITATV